MPRRYTQITFSPPVQAAQERYGAKAIADKMATGELDDRTLTWKESAFIQQRDSFYMATVGSTGWPYVQFRGGPPGFLKVLGPRTLGYADFRGNRQYISVGNLSGDDRVSLFLIDYPNRRRLKLMARARVVDAEEDPELVAQLQDPDYDARVERAIVFELEAFDWNCPQHITRRFTEAEVAKREGRLRARIAELEHDLAAARAEHPSGEPSPGRSLRK